MNKSSYYNALEIRVIENKFLELFSEGKLNGTVHTSVGQEFSAIAFAGQLQQTDFIFSNHRCHGHYIAFTGDKVGLIAELMGKKNGTCGGVGSSQHLCKGNFFSNGIQGGIIPVAAGFALANKLKKNKNIGIVFIGDGTLGEGVLYETLNIISKWEIPLLIVCENNSYAQSTQQKVNLAGDILKRADAFDVKTFKSNTWNVEKIIDEAEKSIDYVRNNQKPAFHLVDTYRLNAHSKGDDNRNEDEVKSFYDKDPLNVFSVDNKKLYEEYYNEISNQINKIVTDLESVPELSLAEYFENNSIFNEYSWTDLNSENVRQVQLINEFFKEKMALDDKVVFIGEDVLSPYGGAFKVAKDLSEKFPENVFSTPISEAAITGISNGLALAGMKPFLEIMFGDFITLAFDQIINHASKFYHMYNKQITCPVVIRTPMGGGRGYGPTHSQSLEKFLIGIDNVTVLALNTLINPKEIYTEVLTEQHPVIVIENKLDYGKKINKNFVKNYKFEKSSHKYPIAKICPVKSDPNATIVTYGGTTNVVLNLLEKLFVETELKFELLVISKISPVDINVIIDSVQKTKMLFVVEEGSAMGGFGSEIIANISENIDDKLFTKRIASLPVPIPSVKSLENEVLTLEQNVFNQIIKSLNK
ncbi:MAG: hypothetical protein JXR68_07375 [Bacteroidales bacterium]|nr:hypothetical protein [Bacteroidales bacterium]